MKRLKRLAVPQSLIPRQPPSLIPRVFKRQPVDAYEPLEEDAIIARRFVDPPEMASSPKPPSLEAWQIVRTQMQDVRDRLNTESAKWPRLSSGVCTLGVALYAILAVCEWTIYEKHGDTAGVSGLDGFFAYANITFAFVFTLECALKLQHFCFNRVGAAYVQTDVCALFLIIIINIAFAPSTIVRFLLLCLSLLRFLPVLAPLGELLPHRDEYTAVYVMVALSSYSLLIFVDLAWRQPPDGWTVLHDSLSSVFVLGFTVEQAAKLSKWGRAQLHDVVGAVDFAVVATAAAATCAGWLCVLFDTALRELLPSLPPSATLARLLWLVRLRSSSRRLGGTAYSFKLADTTFQLSCLSLLLCAAAIVLVTADDALAKVLGGAISMLSVAYVLECYLRRGWERYPNRLLLWRSVASLMTAVSVTAFGVVEAFPDLAPSPSCPTLVRLLNPPLLQFGFVASEAWGFLLGWDVIQQVRNPLSSNDTQLRFHAFAWGVALIWSAIVLRNIVELWPQDVSFFSPSFDTPSSAFCKAAVSSPSAAACAVHPNASAVASGDAARRPPMVTINTLPISCWQHGPLVPAPAAVLRDVWWLPVFNGAAILMLLGCAYYMNGSSRVALHGRKRAITRSTVAIFSNLSFWLPIYLGVVLVSGLYMPRENGVCVLQSPQCRPFASWPCGDGTHNLLATLHLLVSAQGFFCLLLFSALNRTGVYARPPRSEQRAREIYSENFRNPQRNARLREELLSTIRRGVLRTALNAEVKAKAEDADRGGGGGGGALVRARTEGNVEVHPERVRSRQWHQLFHRPVEPPDCIQLDPPKRQWSDSGDEEEEAPLIASFASGVAGFLFPDKTRGVRQIAGAAETADAPACAKTSAGGHGTHSDAANDANQPAANDAVDNAANDAAKDGAKNAANEAVNAANTAAEPVVHGAPAGAPEGTLSVAAKCVENGVAVRPWDETAPRVQRGSEGSASISERLSALPLPSRVVSCDAIRKSERASKRGSSDIESGRVTTRRSSFSSVHVPAYTGRGYLSRRTGVRTRINAALCNNCWQLKEMRVVLALLQLLAMLLLATIACPCTRLRGRADGCFMARMSVFVLALLLWPQICFSTPRSVASCCLDWLIASLGLAFFIGYVFVEQSGCVDDDGDTDGYLGSYMGYYTGSYTGSYVGSYGDGYTHGENISSSSVGSMNGSLSNSSTSSYYAGTEHSKDDDGNGEVRCSQRYGEPLLAFCACARLLSLFQSLLRRQWLGCSLRCALSIPTPAVRFAALSPQGFHRVRAASGVSAKTLEESLSFTDGVGGLQGGRSGAFLFPSTDGMLVVKTLKCDAFTNEVQTLVDSADAFAKYFRLNPNSLIVRVLGVYRMRLFNETIHFVVMRNVAAAARGAPALATYDLKGSSVKRMVKLGANSQLSNLTLKDMNLRSHGLLGTPRNHGMALPLLSSTGVILGEQIQKDTMFLRKNIRVMDYSLLLKVYRKGVLQSVASESKSEHFSFSIISDVADSDVDLVLGIIDLPQEWTLKCELGRAFKTVECVLRGENPLDISTVPVDYYQERFCTFFKETLFKRSRRSQVRKDERPALQAMNDNLSTDCIPIQERRDSL